MKQEPKVKNFPLSSGVLELVSLHWLSIADGAHIFPTVHSEMAHR